MARTKILSDLEQRVCLQLDVAWNETRDSHSGFITRFLILAHEFLNIASEEREENKKKPKTNWGPVLEIIVGNRTEQRREGPEFGKLRTVTEWPRGGEQQQLTVTGATTEHRGAREQTAAATAGRLMLAPDVVEILFFAGSGKTKQRNGRQREEGMEREVKTLCGGRVQCTRLRRHAPKRDPVPPLPPPRSWRSLPGADDTSLRLHAHTRTINKTYNHGNASKTPVTFSKDARRCCCHRRRRRHRRCWKGFVWIRISRHSLPKQNKKSLLVLYFMSVQVGAGVGAGHRPLHRPSFLCYFGYGSFLAAAAARRKKEELDHPADWFDSSSTNDGAKNKKMPDE